MELILGLVGVLGVSSIVFVLAHLRPLSEHEVRQLGEKKRKNQIRKYFEFSKGERSINREFKKRMNPNGQFYRLNEHLLGFPSVAAALLKYKKHEWIIVAFEKQQNIHMIWLNKGFDKSTVSLYLPFGELIDIAKEGNYTSILFFHNHPNPDPYHYDYSKPSNQDFVSANKFSQVLNEHGINLIEFVCERGIHHSYFASCADAFLPVSTFVATIDEVNGTSKLWNLSLHIQRVFYPPGEPLRMNRRHHL